VVALEFACRGIAVPAAVAMVGLGEVEHADFLPTPLTTIVFPRRQRGEVAAAQCEGEAAGQRIWDLGFERHVRACTRTGATPRG
jgi:DNA-binding LacI/PurR family transcriptional regulator